MTDSFAERLQSVLAADDPDSLTERAVSTAAVDHPAVAFYRFTPDPATLTPEEYTDAFTSVAPLDAVELDESTLWRRYLDNDPGPVPDSEAPFDRDGYLVPVGEYGALVWALETTPSDEVVECWVALADAIDVSLDRFDLQSDLQETVSETGVLRKQLTQIEDLNDLVRAISRVLLSQRNREGIESAVCASLAEQFAFAWIGGIEFEDGVAVAPRAWSGSGSEYLDADAVADANEPSVRAAKTGELTVVGDVSEHFHDESWRAAALARGFQSALAVPIAFTGVNYGVITVYAADTHAFDETVVSVFEDLGDVVAYAINAAEWKTSVLSERVVELDLLITDDTDLLQRLAGDADCLVEFERLIPGKAHPILFIKTVGADVETVESSLAAQHAVRSVNLVSSVHDTNRFEIEITGQTLPLSLLEQDAIPRRVQADPAEIRATVHVQQYANVRDVISALRRRYDNVVLVSRSDRDAPDRSPESFFEELQERLTPRQEEVLEMAYFSGYFESPRASTGSEVGEALGISQPTFNHHLRAAQRTLLSLLFRDEDV